jgi:hypothetical protein
MWVGPKFEAKNMCPMPPMAEQPSHAVALAAALLVGLAGPTWGEPGPLNLAGQETQAAGWAQQPHQQAE